MEAVLEHPRNLLQGEFDTWHRLRQLRRPTHLCVTMPSTGHRPPATWRATLPPAALAGR